MCTYIKSFVVLFARVSPLGSEISPSRWQHCSSVAGRIPHIICGIHRLVVEFTFILSSEVFIPLVQCSLLLGVLKSLVSICAERCVTAAPVVGLMRELTLQKYTLFIVSYISHFPQGIIDRVYW